MQDKTLRRWIREFHEAHRKAAAHQAEADKLKAKIKQELQARAVDEYKAGSVVVHCKEVVTPRFDVTAFKAANKPLYEQYAKPSRAVRLTVLPA